MTETHVLEIRGRKITISFDDRPTEILIQMSYEGNGSFVGWPEFGTWLGEITKRFEGDTRPVYIAAIKAGVGIGAGRLR